MNHTEVIIMTEMNVKLPKGIEERMEILIAEGLYASKAEIISDALRRLIERELSVLIAPYRYYWNKLKYLEDVEISEEELDEMIHEIREKRIPETGVS
jgi:Arc/MetJ-type ribon-helix-helix transcriptional regulator